MNEIITEDYAAMSRAAADWFCERVAKKPDAVVVFPTGSTPVGLFKELIARRTAGQFDPSRLRIFQMDDYYPVDPADPRSLYGWLKLEFSTAGHSRIASGAAAGNAPDLSPRVATIRRWRRRQLRSAILVQD